MSSVKHKFQQYYELDQLFAQIKEMIRKDYFSKSYDQLSHALKMITAEKFIDVSPIILRTAPNSIRISLLIQNLKKQGKAFNDKALKSLRDQKEWREFFGDDDHKGRDQLLAIYDGKKFPSIFELRVEAQRQSFSCIPLYLIAHLWMDLPRMFFKEMGFSRIVLGDSCFAIEGNKLVGYMTNTAAPLLESTNGYIYWFRSK